MDDSTGPVVLAEVVSFDWTSQSIRLALHNDEQDVTASTRSVFSLANEVVFESERTGARFRISCKADGSNSIFVHPDPSRECITLKHGDVQYFRTNCMTGLDILPADNFTETSGEFIPLPGEVLRWTIDAALYAPVDPAREAASGEVRCRVIGRGKISAR